MWLINIKYRRTVTIIKSNQYIQVKSSAEMEPYSCKTLLLNLAHEHGVKMTSFTTDRSSSVKTVLR